MDEDEKKKIEQEVLEEQRRVKSGHFAKKVSSSNLKATDIVDEEILHCLKSQP